MPLAANVRIAPTATDSTAGAPSDGAAPAEIFGEIISGLAEASVEGALEAPIAVTTEATGTQPPPQVGELEVAETVEQLLALASSRPAGAKPATPLMVEAPKDGLPEDEAEMPVSVQDTVLSRDVPVPQAVAALSPAIRPLAQHRPVALAADVETPASSTDQPKPDTSAVSDLPQIAPPQPDAVVAQVPPDLPQAALPRTSAIAPKVALGSPAPEARSVPAADQAIRQTPAQTPQIASSRTEAVVQLALSGLEAAVKAMPRQSFAARSGTPATTRAEIESTLSHTELKLSPALISPSTNPLAAAFESLRPADLAPIGTQSAPQPLDVGEMMIEHQLDMAHEGEWLDQLARDISRSAGSDSSPLRFRLNPENLGTLRVEISQDRNGAAIRLTTDTEAARTIIADAQPRLIAEARAQGIRISEAHVDLGGQTASGDPRRQNALFEEAPLRTARSLQEHGEGDGNPTPGQSERYA